MQGRHPHPSTPGGGSSISDESHDPPNRGKRRGGYNCGRCGLPKKGHSCHAPTTTTPSDSNSVVPSPLSAVRPQAPSHLRRALSFDNMDIQA
ncbi:hypothetical protein CsSME_00041767 [Camellia sinensis var. sinensis]